MEQPLCKNTRGRLRTKTFLPNPRKAGSLGAQGSPFKILILLIGQCSMAENSSVLEKCTLTEADSNTLLKNASILENEDHISSSSIISLIVNDCHSVTKKGVEVVPEAYNDISGQIKGYGVSRHDNLGTVERNTILGSSSCLILEECSHSDYTDLWDASKGLCCPPEESVLCMEKHHQRLAFFCLGDKSSEELNDSIKRQSSRFCPILLLRNNKLKDSGHSSFKK